MFVPCSSHPVEQELLPALPVPLRVIWGFQQSRTELRNPFCSWEGAWELLGAEVWGLVQEPILADPGSALCLLGRLDPPLPRGTAKGGLHFAIIFMSAGCSHGI